jgi:hypothetical protein
MTRRIVLVICLVTVAAVSIANSPAMAQDRFELTPFVGYRWGADFDVQDPDNVFRSLQIDDSGAYGLIFDFNLGEQGQLEFLWNRQETQLQGRTRQGNTRVDITDMDVDYWHVGGNFLFGDDLDDTRGFLNFLLGATHYSPDGFSSETQFSFSFGGGAKFYFSETVGIRVQGRFISTYINSTSQWWCNFGCYTVSVGNYVVQAEVDVGLIFRF